MLPAIEWPHPAGRQDSGLLIVQRRVAGSHANEKAAIHTLVTLESEIKDLFKGKQHILTELEEIKQISLFFIFVINRF